MLSSVSPLLGIALGTIKDGRYQTNIGAIKPDGVVNMDSNLQQDVEFGEIVTIENAQGVLLMRKA